MKNNNQVLSATLYYPFYWQHVGKKRIRSKQFVIR